LSIFKVAAIAIVRHWSYYRKQAMGKKRLSNPFPARGFPARRGLVKLPGGGLPTDAKNYSEAAVP
jgi:hypothetical protein